MATAYGPSIVRDGLVLNLDAANPKSVPIFSVEVLVVAGGGGGGHGGGGAGGLIYNSAFSVNPGTALTVTVGAGGTGGISGSRGGTPAGANGGNSVFGSLTSIGGGGGSAAGAANAGNGGSGGGQGGDNNAATRTSGTAGQGFGGGRSSRASYGAAGGGGGAGGAGSDATDQSGTIGQGGNGGVGLQYSISGSNVFYAGGGGGGANLNTPDTTASGGGVGGTGGGGSGGLITDSGFRAATTPNTGGGGGGAEYEGSLAGGGAGGSGIVVVRYYGPQRATGGTITSVGGYTIHAFTTVGSTTFTPDATWSDLSGNANSGTLTDGPTYSSANGGYISFNGTSNYITNSTNLFSGRTTTTGAYWVYITAYPSGNVGVLHMWNGVSQLAYDTTSGGIPQFWINGALIVSGNQLSLNTWHYMTWVTDGAFARIYTNGVLVNSGAFTAAIATSAQPMYIFRRSDSATYMAGRLSSLSVYNRALSAAEIQQNFNAHRGRYGV